MKSEESIHRAIEIFGLVVGRPEVGGEAWAAVMRAVSAQRSLSDSRNVQEHVIARIICGWVRLGSSKGAYKYGSMRVSADGDRGSRIGRSGHSSLDRSQVYQVCHVLAAIPYVLFSQIALMTRHDTPPPPLHLPISSIRPIPNSTIPPSRIPNRHPIIPLPPGSESQATRNVGRRDPQWTDDTRN